MQLQPSLSDANLAPFGFDCGISTETEIVRRLAPDHRSPRHALAQGNIMRQGRDCDFHWYSAPEGRVFPATAHKAMSFAESVFW